MFALRGIAVSFSIFALLYCALSVAVWGLWRRVWVRGQRYSARRCADLLFALRTLPFVAAAGVTLILAVPSFLLLEPRSVDEPLSAAPIVLGMCGIAVALWGIWNASAALARASRTVARWAGEARALGSRAIASGDSDSSAIELRNAFDNAVPVQRVSASAPPLTASGILRSTLWLSRSAEFALTERELETALRHEVAHIRRRDNLRKLILCLVALPGMAELEIAWREASEMAADDAAVSSASEALDLAAALIKLSRLTPLHAPAELTTALVHSPAESVNARVERLVAWMEPRGPIKEYSLKYALCVAAVVVTALAATYSHLLVQVHEATEWLVR